MLKSDVLVNYKVWYAHYFTAHTAAMTLCISHCNAGFYPSISFWGGLDHIGPSLADETMSRVCDNCIEAEIENGLADGWCIHLQLLQLQPDKKGCLMWRGEAEVNMYKHCKGEHLIPGSINSFLNQDPVFGSHFWRSIIQSDLWGVHLVVCCCMIGGIPLALSERQGS